VVWPTACTDCLTACFTGFVTPGAEVAGDDDEPAGCPGDGEVADGGDDTEPDPACPALTTPLTVLEPVAGTVLVTLERVLPASDTPGAGDETACSVVEPTVDVTELTGAEADGRPPVAAGSVPAVPGAVDLPAEVPALPVGVADDVADDVRSEPRVPVTEPRVPVMVMEARRKVADACPPVGLTAARRRARAGSMPAAAGEVRRWGAPRTVAGAAVTGRAG
jgi:hypothetical protein